MSELVGAHWPWRGLGEGPLPALLIALTVVTGLVDAVSYVALGHVFVANMTGNVVFLGFAIAGAHGLSASASLLALAAFFAGALGGGRLAVRIGAHRGRQLVAGAGAGGSLLVVAAIVAAILGQPVSGSARYALIVPLALAMGAQNATARRLAVPDLTTTVLTLTLTGVAADSRLARGSGGRPGRRLIAVSAMLAGAVVGALLVLRVDLALPIALAALLAVGVSITASSLAVRPDASWAQAPAKG
ncbi:MAG: YoaK family protein [Solirubrobacteraceae bacterium]